MKLSFLLYPKRSACPLSGRGEAAVIGSGGIPEKSSGCR
jgi:hypothetical protein